LQEERYAFTYGEMNQACADIDSLPGAVNGFGLLQGVEQCLPKRRGNIAFLHHAIQVYLAALHVSMLDDKQQVHLINKIFWPECQFLYYVENVLWNCWNTVVDSLRSGDSYLCQCVISKVSRHI